MNGLPKTVDPNDAGTELFLDARQKNRLTHVRADKSATIVAWDPRLAFDIAMVGADKAMAVFERYALDQQSAIELLQNPVFQQQLKTYRAELEANGLTYRQKARILAEDLLPHGYDLATDVTVPASVRADMIQWMTKVADLEPAKASGKDIGVGGGAFSLSILFAGERPAQTVGAAPITIEGERQ